MGHAVTVVGHLDGVVSEADLDPRRVGVVAVFDQFGQGDVLPPDEALTKFS